MCEEFSYKQLLLARSQEVAFTNVLLSKITPDLDADGAQIIAKMIKEQIQVTANLTNKLCNAFCLADYPDNITKYSYFKTVYQDTIIHRRLEWERSVIELNRKAIPQNPPNDAITEVEAEFRHNAQVVHQCLSGMIDLHRETGSQLTKVTAELEAMKKALRELKMETFMVTTFKAKPKIGDKFADERMSQIMDLLQEIASKNKKKTSEMSMKKFKCVEDNAKLLQEFKTLLGTSNDDEYKTVDEDEDTDEG